MVQYVRMCCVRYFFPEAARAGSIAGFNTLDAGGAECIAVM